MEEVKMLLWLHRQERRRKATSYKKRDKKKKGRVCKKKEPKNKQKCWYFIERLLFKYFLYFLDELIKLDYILLLKEINRFIIISFNIFIVWHSFVLLDTLFGIWINPKKVLP